MARTDLESVLLDIDEICAESDVVGEAHEELCVLANDAHNIGHAAAVKAIAEWIRNPHEDAENNWTPSWVADAIERGEPFRPQAGK